MPIGRIKRAILVISI